MKRLVIPLLLLTASSSVDAAPIRAKGIVKSAVNKPTVLTLGTISTSLGETNAGLVTPAMQGSLIMPTEHLVPTVLIPSEDARIQRIPTQESSPKFSSKPGEMKVNDPKGFSAISQDIKAELKSIDSGGIEAMGANGAHGLSQNLTNILTGEGPRTRTGGSVLLPSRSRTLSARERGLAPNLNAADPSNDPHVELPGSTFDGVTVKKPSLSSPSVWFQGIKMKLIGHGDFGRVFKSPGRPGIIYKLLDLNFDALVFGGQTVAASAREEHEVSKVVSETGLGPKYYGKRVLSGRSVFAKQEIYGETVDQLVAKREFGEKERALVDSLLDRMADKRVRIDDMQLRNIMIGTTREDPVRRAFIIDGQKETVLGYDLKKGSLNDQDRKYVEDLFARYKEAPLSGENDHRLASIRIGKTHRNKITRAYYVDKDGALPLYAEPNLSRSDYRDFLDQQPIVKKVNGNPMQGNMDTTYISLKWFLDHGVARSKETGWWQKFKTGFIESLVNAQMPAK